MGRPAVPPGSPSSLAADCPPAMNAQQTCAACGCSARNWATTACAAARSGTACTQAMKRLFLMTSSLWAGCARVRDIAPASSAPRLEPAQAGRGAAGLSAAAGLVLASDPAFPVALSRHLVDDAEQVLVVQLANIRFMALGHPGQLEVADMSGRQVLPDLHRHIALDDLAVVQVHLHLEVGGAYLSDEGVRGILPIEVEARNVAGVDRLDQQVDALARRLRRGP